MIKKKNKWKCQRRRKALSLASAATGVKSNLDQLLSIQFGLIGTIGKTWSWMGSWCRQKKNERNNELRKWTDDIQILVSTVSKNVESLEQYNNYKMFLDGLASVQEKEEHEKVLALAKKETMAREGGQKRGNK